jgi:hypothetical protein
MARSIEPDGKGNKDPEFRLLCGFFEEEFGHGWKRRLAKVAGVPESNVHSWIKTGKMPPWVLRIFRLTTQNRYFRANAEALSKEIEVYRLAHSVVADGEGFSVFRMEKGVGQLVAKGIPNLEIAREIAGLPVLKEKYKNLETFVRDLAESSVTEEMIDDDTLEVLDSIDSWKHPPALSVTFSEMEAKDIVAGLVQLSKEMEKQNL